MNEEATPEQVRIKELAQEVTDLTLALQDKDQAEKQQVRAWAIDRGIETLKHNNTSEMTHEDVISYASAYVDWVFHKEEVV